MKRTGVLDDNIDKIMQFLELEIKEK